MKHLNEYDIMNDMVSPDLGDLSPEAVNALLALRFKPAATERMNELAEKNRGATISAAEREEMENFRRVGDFLAILKAKARLSLRARQSVP